MLKASAIIGGDLSSHSAVSFKGFYANETPPAQSILVSPQQPNKQPSACVDVLVDDDQEKTEKYAISNSRILLQIYTQTYTHIYRKVSSTRSNEPTLAEQFEQIKHCRYIRRYHPDGTALEEYY